jgi:glucosyl-3-phosphoglycerate synthase
MTAPVVATHHHREYRARELAGAKAGLRVSVCLPARDEERTIGAIVTTVVEELVEGTGLVDEVLVVDDRSTDRTAELAAAAGARVVTADSVLAEHGPGGGKGEALWKSLAACDGDLVVWCDADVANFGAHFVVGLLGPLLTTDVDFVKAFYARPLHGRAGEGGRVTELVARPLLSHLLPHLAGFAQPLAGEYAGRRTVLEQVPFVQDYGVEVGLLADLADLVGLRRMAQVDLGERVHRNRPLPELAPQAMAILQVALDRAGAPPALGRSSTLLRPDAAPVEVPLRERPPLADIARRRSA